MCDTNSSPYKYIGYSSGFILSICLIPQIYKVIKNWSASDISYIWQCLYFMGLSLNIIYCYYENIIPILIPAVLEITLCTVLIILKVYIDVTTDANPGKRNGKNDQNKSYRGRLSVI
uniref:PQ-loop repeat-containing protein n=1 Tax=viral metagenome TaxID=1070528 RepID=A0A6C0EJF3_9ZZZZ